jgi:hypothetical protein
MEVIDARTRDQAGLKVTISIYPNEIYFNKMAAAKLGIEANRRLTFLSDVDRLYFYISDDPFGIRLHAMQSGGVKLYGSKLYRVLKEKVPSLLANGHIFPLKQLKTQVQGNELIEILFHKKP